MHQAIPTPQPVQSRYASGHTYFSPREQLFVCVCVCVCVCAKLPGHISTVFCFLLLQDVSARMSTLEGNTVLVGVASFAQHENVGIEGGIAYGFSVAF